MKDLFYYKRVVKTKKKIEYPERTDIEGKPKDEIVEVTVWDCFNLNSVLRGVWVGEKMFAVLLDDGHEEARDTEKPLFNAKGAVKGVQPVRQREWIYSQIELDREDALRFRVVTEKLLGEEESEHPAMGELGEMIMDNAMEMA